jgi:hypothetical protein
MNKLLEQAVATVATLPDEAQEAIASLIMDEVDAERGWAERFGRSGEMLAEMARRALAQDAAGETTELVFPPDK